MKDGGKQINHTQSESFEHYCMAASLSLTLGPGWIGAAWKHLRYNAKSQRMVLQSFCMCLITKVHMIFIYDNKTVYIVYPV